MKACLRRGCCWPRWGSRAAFYGAQYFRQHKLATEGTRVRIIAEKVKHPAVRIDNFQIEIETPVELSPHRVGVESAVHHCLIHNARVG
jgi:hypothetical protein